MALVPSRQFYPSSFQSSFSRFHGTPLQLFRCGSSKSVKSYVLFPTHYAISSKSTAEESPFKKSSYAFVSKPFCSSSWIDKWNGQSKRNQPKPPQVVFNYRTRGGGGGSGGSTMDKIVEKLKKFGYMDDSDEKRVRNQERAIEKGSVEDIFYIEEGMLPNTRGGFSVGTSLDEENVFKSNGDVRFPWEKQKEEEEEEGKWSARMKSRFSLAELTLPESELKRLRNLTFKTKNKMKIGGSGVTQAVVDMIHEKWKTSEIVKLKIDGAPALNMKRMHEILERKTGGLVIWRSGTSVSLYRGVGYEDPSLQLKKRMFNRKEILATLPSAATSDQKVRDASQVGSLGDAHDSTPKLKTSTEDKKNTEPLPEVEYEHEIDKLLDGLGPRYTDWPGCDPHPVDADLLPGVVPGYERPFRVLPYGVRSTLGQKEATALRRLARVLPPHFALGRRRHLQGLSLAMTKLWEKSLVAKIALKRGVPLTTSERMAEEIKKLTGGTLLSRNKDFLVFYRGKDFLLPEVTEALLERERLAKSLHDEEEQARRRASAFLLANADPTEQSVISEQSGAAGTLAETLDANARWGKELDDQHKEKVMREAEMIRHANVVKKLEQKLALAERKLMKAERALSKVEESLKPAERQADPESITEEERFMFRKLGLRMKAFLLLGRRGVFDGTVENMHLHWKYRELIKIIVKAKSFEQVKKVALALESESGGILVSVDKISKGYAIIVYRGKDYKRPSMLRPKNLLTKRKALARSIELQRREALLEHMSNLESRVGQLRAEIGQMAKVKDQGDEALYNRLDFVYPTDDENSEDDDTEAYLETYKSENDSESGSDNSVDGLYLDTNVSYDVQDDEVLTAEEEEEEKEEEEEEKEEAGVASVDSGSIQ